MPEERIFVIEAQIGVRRIDTPVSRSVYGFVDREEILDGIEIRHVVRIKRPRKQPGCITTLQVARAKVFGVQF